MSALSRPASPVPPLPSRRGGFSVIYADPPWNYGNKGTRAAAARNYSTLTLEDLKRIPVAAAAAPNAALFLWSTAPFVPAALELGEAWGFRYKTVAFLWAKRNRKSNTPFFGMGNWTRANVEPVLLFTRGEIRRSSAAVSQFVWSPILRHSEKPPIVRALVEKLMGNVPRLELFSRHEVKGWARWGNELLP